MAFAFLLMQVKKLLRSLGEGCYSLQKFSSYADDIIHFKKTTAAVAGTPYFIYVNKTVEDPKFYNVTFVLDVNLGWNGYTADWRGAIIINDNLTFRGLLLKKENYELYNATSDQTINAYYLSGNREPASCQKTRYYRFSFRRN